MGSADNTATAHAVGGARSVALPWWPSRHGVLTAVALWVTVAGCGSTGDGFGGTLTPTTLGAGLTVSIPAMWSVTPFGATDPAGASSIVCSTRDATINGSSTVVVDTLLVSKVCVGGSTRPIGNGFHGIYLSAKDAPTASNVSSSAVVAGTLTTFDQQYYECTQGCAYFTDHIALLALNHPPDVGRPTLMMVDVGHTLTDAELATLAGTITAGS